MYGVENKVHTVNPQIRLSAPQCSPIFLLENQHSSYHSKSPRQPPGQACGMHSWNLNLVGAPQKSDTANRQFVDQRGQGHRLHVMRRGQVSCQMCKALLIGIRKALTLAEVWKQVCAADYKAIYVPRIFGKLEM
jgi:hypothetical protein